MANKFIQKFEKKVKETIKNYNLASYDDKILVACSGGKDSTTVLYLLHKFGYDVGALMIDLHIGEWSRKNLENVKIFCKDNGIKLNLVDLKDEIGYSMCYIRSGIQSKVKLTNCMICGTIRRKILNKAARKLKASKLATGHNLDDEAETILMNLMKGNLKLILGLGPKVGIIEDKGFVQRIKPLFFLTNEEIRKYSLAMKFPVIYEKCPCLRNTFRLNIRNFLAELEKENPKIKHNIVYNFMKILPKLRKKYTSHEKIRYCSICGEPSRDVICKGCKLMSILKINHY